MIMYVYILVALTGVILGSFLTALNARLHVKTMTRGRSACSVCGTTLRTVDLLPVLSFILQRGRCRYCESRIPYGYIMTEVGLAVLLVLVARHIFTVHGIHTLSVIVFSLYSFAFVALVALSLYDLKHFIIPDRYVVLFIIGGYIARFAEFSLWHVPITYLDIFAGPLLALPFLIVWLLSRGTWIGFGDVKLAVGMGGLLGVIGGVSAIVLGVWVGAVSSLFFMYIPRILPSSFPLGRTQKRLTMKSEVPFGPYLALGTLLAFLYFTDVIGIGLLL